MKRTDCPDRWWVFLAALVVVLGSPVGLWAQRFPPDPVEALRQALRQDEKAPRDEAILKELKANLEKKAAAISSPGDLGRALLLQEWGAKGLDPVINDGIWNDLANRFEREVKGLLKRGDVTSQVAARLVSETATLARQGGIEMQRLEARLPTFARELIALTGSKDAAVSVAAMQALGRINPDPEKAVGALEQILKTPQRSDGQRRAAAEALLNMIQVAAEIVKKRQGDPANLVRTGRAAVLAASRGVEDSDPTVRRFCLDAIQQATPSSKPRAAWPIRSSSRLQIRSISRRRSARSGPGRKSSGPSNTARKSRMSVP
jgi:hypothetical protein